MIENHIHVALKGTNKYIPEYRLCPNIWSLFENQSAIFNENHVFSGHMNHYKDTVAILSIFETGPIWGVRDPTPFPIEPHCKIPHFGNVMSIDVTLPKWAIFTMGFNGEILCLLSDPAEISFLTT